MTKDLKARHRSILKLLEKLGVENDDDAGLTVYHLHEVDGILREVQGLVSNLDDEAKAPTPSASRIGTLLARIEVELYDHLPDHLSKLRPPFRSVFARVVAADEAGGQ